MRFLIVACVAAALLSSAVVAAPRHPSPRLRMTSRGSRATAQDVDLPDGDGKKILQASCTVCHDLTEVTKFKGYYSRDEWRDIVKTMVAYGAKLDAKETEVLVDYLDTHLGKKN